jgi:hypothetical protein
VTLQLGFSRVTARIGRAGEAPADRIGAVRFPASRACRLIGGRASTSGDEPDACRPAWPARDDRDTIIGMRQTLSAPIDPALRAHLDRALREVTLDDEYELERGHAVIPGRRPRGGGTAA